MSYVKLADGSVVKSLGTPSEIEKNYAIDMLKGERSDWLLRKDEYLALAQQAQEKADALQVTISELSVL